MGSCWRRLSALYREHWWLTPLTLFIVWRLGLEIIGRATLAVTMPVLNPWPADPTPPLWARWDSGWYSSIVSHGYQLRPGLISNVTFFPLYPLLWKALWLATGLPRLAAGVLTANLMAAAAVTAAYRWVQVAQGTRLARHALGLLLAFPASFFLIAAYSESTFLLLTALMLLAAERRHWLMAAIAAALASATRPIGLALWPALAVLWWYAPEPKRNWRQAAVLLLLPPLGLAAFSLHLWHATGDHLAWLHSQAMAGRSYAFPLKLLVTYAHNVLTMGELWLTRAGELAALGFACTLLPSLWRHSRGQAVLVLGMLLPPVFTNLLTSLPRFTLVALPLFTALALVKQRWLTWAYVAASVPLLVLSVYRFVTWRWAG